MKEFDTIKTTIKVHKIIMYILCFCVGFLSYDVYKSNNRLNEHKRLLIAQQEQINQLILNAKYNERNK